MPNPSEPQLQGEFRGRAAAGCASAGSRWEDWHCRTSCAQARRASRCDQGHHHGAAARRADAPGHVRPQAGRPGRDPRRVPADRHERAGHRHLRAAAPAGPHGGQVRRSSARWSASATTTTRTGARPAGSRTRPWTSSPLVPGFPPGDWPSLGSVLSRKLGPRVPGVPPCVDLTPVDADARFILRTPPGQPGYLGVGPRRVRGAGRRSPEHHAQRRGPPPPGRPPGLAGQLRRLPPRGRCARGRATASTRFSGRRSRCSPRRGWPRRSTSAGKTARVRSRYGLDRAYPDEREGKTLPGPVPAGPAGDRGRRPLRHAGVQPLALRPHAPRRLQLGLAQGPLPGGPEDPAAARPGTVGLDRGPRRARPAGGRRRRRLGRVRPHAEDQRRTAAATTGRRCAARLVAGGGMRCGQVLGSTTRWGEEPHTRPVHFRDVFATLYQRLGIDVATTQFTDLAGRPQYLVGDHRPLPELIG